MISIYGRYSCVWWFVDTNIVGDDTKNIVSLWAFSRKKAWRKGTEQKKMNVVKKKTNFFFLLNKQTQTVWERAPYSTESNVKMRENYGGKSLLHFLLSWTDREREKILSWRHCFYVHFVISLTYTSTHQKAFRSFPFSKAFDKNFFFCTRVNLNLFGYLLCVLFYYFLNDFSQM